MNSTARGYNPHFDKAYIAMQHVIDKYPDELEFLTLDCRELRDEYGDVYQVSPVIRISFKG